MSNKQKGIILGPIQKSFKNDWDERDKNIYAEMKSLDKSLNIIVK